MAQSGIHTCPKGIDETFGPWAGPDCRGGFDFTLLFEESILTIPVQCLFLLFLPARVWHLARTQVKIAPGALRPIKLAAALCLLIFYTTLLALRVNGFDKAVIRTNVSTANSVLGLICSLSVVPLSWLEHERSFRPSLLLTGYIFLSALLDLARVRTLWLMSAEHVFAGILLGSLLLRVVILILESTEKRKLLLPQYKSCALDVTRTFFSTTVFWWLNAILLVGYRRTISLKDLYPLDAKLEPEELYAALADNWGKVSDKTASGILFRTSLRTLIRPFMACMIPKLFQIAFTYAQPFLIKSAVEFASTPQGQPYDNHGYGLIAAFAIVYTGLNISANQYLWRINRVCLMLRGAIIGLIYQESLRLDINSPDVSPEGALTMMNTDTENMTEAFHLVHEAWSKTIEVGLAVYLIYRELGAACAMPISVALVIMGAATCLAGPTGLAQAAWVAAAEDRVTATSKTLGNIKGIKISGLTRVAFSIIKKLRDRELEVSMRFRVLLGSIIGLGIGLTVWSPIITFSLYAGLSRRSDSSVNISTIFTAYSVLTLLNEPLTWVLMSLPALVGGLQSFQRIQNYLNGRKRVDVRRMHSGGDERVILSEVIEPDDIMMAQLQSSHGSDLPSPITDDSRSRNFSMAQSPIVARVLGTFSWSESSEPILDIADWTIRRGKFTIVLGPVGCGKTTLLKCFLGELNGFQGRIRTDHFGTAYCSQSAWIPNDTVRNIITCGSKYDPLLYQSVIQACLLEPDIRNWPDGDDTVAGPEGISVSGGQKQRLSLARALYSKKPLLILDDVLSSLDAATEEAICKNLWGEAGLLRRNETTTVLASSSQRCIGWTDEVVTLTDKGTIEISENPNDIRQNTKQNPGSNLKISNPVPAEQQDPIYETKASPEKSLDPEYDDASRRLGDWGMYSLYMRAGGRFALSRFAFCMAIYAFCSTFPSIWLGWWASWAEANGNGNLGKWLGVYAALGFGAVAGALIGIWHLVVGIINRAGVHFHQSLLDTVMGAPLSFHSSIDTGVTVNRFSEDLRLIDMELPVSAYSSTTAFVMLVGQLVMVSVSSRYLAATIPVLLAVLYALQHFYLRTSRQLRLLDIECRAPVNTNLIETLNGLMTIRAYQWEDAFMKKHMGTIVNSLRPLFLLKSVQSWLTFYIDVLITILAIAFITLATTLREQIGASYMGVGLNSILGLATQTRLLMAFWVMLEISLGAVTRVRRFATHTETEGPVGSHEFSDHQGKEWLTQGAIEIKNLAASYKSYKSCLSNITLSIGPGQKIALCGRTGSGKSSLTLCLLRLLDLDTGSITIDGVDIMDLPHEYARTKLVAVPQEVIILKGSVRFNLDPDETSTDEEIKKALEEVQLWSRIEKRGGLDTTIDESSFSQGESQLLVFARAMLRKGKILILDEFTSSLDRETSEIVDRLLRSWFTGWTIISVTHKLQSVLDFDKVAVLSKGELLEYDNPQHLLEHNSAFKALYDRVQIEESEG